MTKRAFLTCISKHVVQQNLKSKTKDFLYSQTHVQSTTRETGQVLMSLSEMRVKKK